MSFSEFINNLRYRKFINAENAELGAFPEDSIPAHDEPSYQLLASGEHPDSSIYNRGNFNNAEFQYPAKGFILRSQKFGDTGQDVWALQLNLNNVGFTLITDGEYGTLTRKAVVTYQRDHGLTTDGIAGARTQKSLGLVNASGPQKQYSTPTGLLRGVIEGESNWGVGAVSPSHADGSRDLGWTQDNTPAELLNDDATVRAAFDGKSSIGKTAKELRVQKDRYYGQAGAKTHELAWHYAVLHHNWQAAAEQFAAGTIDSWVYTATNQNGESQKYKMSDPAYWVEQIGVPGVSTGFEWAKFYVDSKIKYVTEYTP